MHRQHCDQRQLAAVWSPVAETRLNVKINKLCAWRHNILPPRVGAQAPRAPPSRRNVAVLSHVEYVPTLTTAAALREGRDE